MIRKIFIRLLKKNLDHENEGNIVRVEGVAKVRKRGDEDE